MGKDKHPLFAERAVDYAARKAEDLRDILDGTSARGRLVDKVWLDFYDLRRQLDPGIQAVLELHNVPRDVRQAAGEYLGDVLQGLGSVEAEVVKLANVPGAERAGYASLHEKGKDGIER